jgi:hypothetical protein
MTNQTNHSTPINQTNQTNYITSTNTIPKNLDVIKLNLDQFKQLMDWKNLNKDHVRSFDPIIEEALIDVANHWTIHFKEDLNKKTITYNVFKEDDYFYSFMVDVNNRQKIELLDFKFNDKINMNKKTTLFLMEYMSNVDKLTHNDLVADVLTTHASSIAYMQYQKKEIITRQESIKLTKKEQERYDRELEKLEKLLSSNVKEITPNVITIKATKKVYVYPDVIKLKTLTKKEIKAGAWTVRGFTRVKNGKVETVRPYVKGKDKEKREMLKAKIFNFKFDDVFVNDVNKNN